MRVDFPESTGRATPGGASANDAFRQILVNRVADGHAEFLRALPDGAGDAFTPEVNSKGVALECAQNRWKVRVNSVHPGIIETPIWQSASAASIRPDGAAVDVAAMAEIAVPTGVLGQPRDIADGVLFLASDDSTYITGTELVIDAGLSA